MAPGGTLTFRVPAHLPRNARQGSPAFRSGVAQPGEMALAAILASDFSSYVLGAKLVADRGCAITR